MATYFDRQVTVIDIIKRAFRLIGVYSIGEAPTADESNDALEALNAMLDEWANESLMIPVTTLDSISVTSGVATYTIGSSGGTVSNRPVKISSATYLQHGAISYPLEILTDDEYANIGYKGLAGFIPCALVYHADMPNATITLYPTPSDAMTLKLYSIKQLNVFENLTDEIALPPGYENAIVYNLAKDLAGEYEAGVPASVLARAKTTKLKLKRTNFEPLMLTVDRVPARFNILSGQ